MNQDTKETELASSRDRKLEELKTLALLKRPSVVAISPSPAADEPPSKQAKSTTLADPSGTLDRVAEEVSERFANKALPEKVSRPRQNIKTLPFEIPDCITGNY